MATGSMSQIEGEIQGGSGSTGKEAGGSIRTNPAGRRREDRIVGATQATRDLVAQATAASRSAVMTPGWVTTTRFSESISMTRSISSIASTTQPSMALAPPLRSSAGWAIRTSVPDH